MKYIIQTCAATLVALLSFVTVNASADTRPNIVFILVDDMGWSDIGCYGSEIQTPNLDRLAAQGIRFTQMHNTAKCFPSRACLLTGVYAQQSGTSQKPGNYTNSVTLGEVLREAGYRTYASGKHHSNESLYDRGFDRYYGLLDGANNQFNPGLKRPGESAPAQKKPGARVYNFDERQIRPYTPEEADFYTTDYYTKWAMEFLEEDKESEKPFFLYLSYTAPHDNLQAWPEDIAKYEAVYKDGYAPIRAARGQKMKALGLIPEDTKISEPTYRDWDSLSDEEQAKEAKRMAIYAAMIDRVDQNIGQLLAQLEALGELENTLILFASDNGASAESPEAGLSKKFKGEMGSVGYWASQGSDWANVSNTPFRKAKSDSYQGGICTSFIVNWPLGITSAGSITAYPSHFIDIMATLVDLTGADYPTEYRGEAVTPMQGLSLLPVFESPETSVARDQALYWQWAKGKAVRLGDWKLVASGNNWELFNLADDITETTDLTRAYPEKAQAMKAMFSAWYASTPAGAGPK
ncbi:arylsulfatase [Coraliomargarita algicola]|uniref:Arylsulfatase n=1 Tax=Coraliomargarita algicola TaxID=3092156 RepID=A0ABZ0RLV3_9BACT|nr:arylsulfatase [Coraliomargarita sp. J2-16]WPJ96423.1 arylsulfatase [Coraliomargarita sp. J2-16]